MLAVLTFAVVLLLAVLVSGWAERTVLSTAVLFLVAGFVTGQGVLGLVPTATPLVKHLAELALFTVLFTDGMRVRFRTRAAFWILPGRALLAGLPLTLLVTALLARYVAGLPWLDSFLVGTVLSPTDPVFASAIVGREEIPFRLRHLLNIESGLNDGLALPIVMVLLSLRQGAQVKVGEELGQLAFGVALGVALTWVLCRVARLRFFGITRSYQSLFPFAVGLLLWALTSLLPANEYLAAFSAGITLGNTSPKARKEFQAFGEALTELLKLAALLVFGALVVPRMLADIGWEGYVFAVLALVLARPVGLGPTLLGTSLDWRERLTAMWFGPRGFASVVYGLLVLDSGVANASWMFHLIAVVVVLSIVAHSSTDVVVARWLRKEPGPASGQEQPPAARAG